MPSAAAWKDGKAAADTLAIGADAEDMDVGGERVFISGLLLLLPVPPPSLLLPPPVSPISVVTAELASFITPALL